jgi:hypothetical protein
VSRINHSADALTEILQMCEEALAALASNQNSSSVAMPVASSRQAKLHPTRKTARPFVLIQGGIAGSSQKLTRR